MRLPLLLATVLTWPFGTWAAADGYDELLESFQEWRDFEQPPSLNGVPDYSAASFERRLPGLQALQARLHAFEPDAWPIPQQVDWHLLRAEMNGMLFNMRVLRPWVRDPAFYTSLWTFESDTPAHEGPNHHALVELWTYSFPLTGADEARLAFELGTIPPLLEHARVNLTGDARELWDGGISRIDGQARSLEDLAERVAGSGTELQTAITEALDATRSFAQWLRSEAGSKTGPSGIGTAYPSPKP